MKHQTCSVWLRIIIAGVAPCGLAVHLRVIPSVGFGIVRAMPEFSSWYLPWLIFLSLTAVPCYAAVVPAWRIALSVGADRAFTAENAARLTLISRLAIGDTIYYFAGNLVFLFLNMNHPGILLLSLLIDFAGIAVYVVCAALSTLVAQAAALQDQSDWTI